MPGSSTTTLTIGSRGSQLAIWQANHVSTLLEGAGIATRIELIKTTGDHLQTASLVQAGGKGLFTKEIEDALLAGTIDLAVHSLKDLPTETPPGLSIAAVPDRGNPFDALVGAKLDMLPKGARVGTSSARRAAQLRVLRPDLDIQPVRGNVETRLRKLKEGQFAAIVLAAAGLRRLGLEEEIAETFTPERMCPAAGQGALGVQTRSHDPVREVVRKLNHKPSFLAVTAERAALGGLGGGCQLPVGAYAEVKERYLRLTAIVVAPDGSRHLRKTAEGPLDDPEQLGEYVASDLLSRGAGAILASV